MGGGLGTIVITGASTGVGLATARRLMKEDCRLVLTAREASLGRFREQGIVESDRLHLRALDVTSSEQRSALVGEALEQWDGVRVLVNNAGVSYRSVVEHATEDDRLRQMDVNFRSPMELARMVLPHMRAERRGQIINVSSVGGMMAMPTMALYSASKFALEGATEALSYEVKPWNIRVSLVQPGFINSDGFEKVRYTLKSSLGAGGGQDPYAAHYQNMAGFIERLMRLVHATPDSVARTIVRTIKRRHPPLRVAGTLDAFIFSLLRRLLPQRIYHFALYRSLPGIRSWGPSDKS